MTRRTWNPKRSGERHSSRWPLSVWRSLQHAIPSMVERSIEKRYSKPFRCGNAKQRTPRNRPEKSGRTAVVGPEPGAG
jgi:hypothetical protein